MNKYRIYALIHGQVLCEGKIFGCEIKKLGFEEQVKRSFAPIQSVFSEREMTDCHKTYITSLRYVDPIKIKSEYVIICEIEEIKPDAALGGAIMTIERIIRFLSLANLEDVKLSHGKTKVSFEPYIYQVNKIYSLDNHGAESEIEYKLESGNMYLPDRPEKTDWRNSKTDRFLDDIFNFHDETLERSLKYLYRSSIGHFLLDSREKIALDHFKSIEIIVNSLSKKRHFKQRLTEVVDLLEFTNEEQASIERFWDQRSTYGDIAHPSAFDEVERYPNQFPIPSNARYSASFLDNIAPSIVLKYYRYIKGVFIIEIDVPSGRDGDSKEGDFSKIYEISIWGFTHHNRLVYYTSEKDKVALIRKLKKAFAVSNNLKESAIIEAIILPKKSELFKNRRIKIRVCQTT